MGPVGAHVRKTCARPGKFVRQALSAPLISYTAKGAPSGEEVKSVNLRQSGTSSEELARHLTTTSIKPYMPMENIVLHIILLEEPGSKRPWKSWS